MWLFFFIVYFERDCEINYRRKENGLLNRVICICVLFSMHDFVHYKWKSCGGVGGKRHFTILIAIAKTTFGTKCINIIRRKIIENQHKWNKTCWIWECRTIHSEILHQQSEWKKNWKSLYSSCVRIGFVLTELWFLFYKMDVRCRRCR